MSNEPRKATDVLLELEAKIDILLNLAQNQDLNIKVLSNKLNAMMSNNSRPQQPQVTVEAVNTNNLNNIPAPPVQIPISTEGQLEIDKSPQGFRRTSRPETYSGDNAYLPGKSTVQPKFPVQIPKSEAIVPKEAFQQTNQQPSELIGRQPKQEAARINSIPIQQRVVDKNGKSVFLADVSVIDVANGEKVFKGRTNGTGKWMAALALGRYKVTISKLEALTKDKVEISQDVTVDGSKSPLDLPMLIFK